MSALCFLLRPYLLETQLVTQFITMWEKKESGNPGGRPKTKLIRQAFLNCLSISEAEKIARPILALAQKGDIEAAKFVRDTVDGPPKQELGITDERNNDIAGRFEEVLAAAAREADAVHPAGRKDGAGRIN